jgi:TonB family protein
MTSDLAGITIIFSAAWLLTLALARSSAAIRHMVWTCAIAAALLYPALHWWAPQRVIQQPLPILYTPGLVVIQAAKAGSSATPRVFGISEIAVAIWALGSLLLTIRLASRAWQFKRVMDGAKPTDKAFPAPILISPRVPGPLVTGVLRPRILLPEDSASWTPARRRAVLAHELAHIRRRDPAILLMTQAATIVYWFHPLCWLAAARLRMESERACDDAALRIGLRPSTYAGQLLDLARLFNPQRAIPMATTSHLESRVKFILDPFVNRSFAPRRTWLAAAVITAAFTAPLTVLSLRAQAPAGIGTIIGIVTDPTGAVVARAQVIASNSQGGNKEIGTSDLAGNFTLSNIPAGAYSMEVLVPGFAVSHANVNLANGEVASAPVKLKVSGAGEQITVVAAGVPKPMTSSSGGTGRRIRVGGNVQAANLLQQVRPVYPGALQAAGIEGTVLLEAVISKDGAPASLTPRNTSVDPAFISAAMDAVRQWRYRPALLNGEPIEVLTTIQVDFKLREGGDAVR